MFLTIVAGVWFAVCGGAAFADVMLGAHVGNSSDPNWQAEFVGLESQIGRKLTIDSDYKAWKDFPNVARIKWDLQTGRLPMQSWLILFDISNPSACATAAQITSGVYDGQIAKQAATIKSLGATIFIRFNYEFNGNKENTCFTGFPNDQNLPLAGQEYVAAWRHVVGLFRAVGATNVVWVWAGGNGDYGKPADWSYFYPGSAYVDWIGFDVYNLANIPAQFGAFPGVQGYYSAMSTLGKPLMVSENAAFNDPLQSPDPQTLWIRTAHTFIKSHPAIAAYIYWDSLTQAPPPPPYSGSGYWLAGSGLAAFKAMANDPYFNATWP